MKKILLLILLTVVLGGCSGKNENETDNAVKPEISQSTSETETDATNDNDIEKVEGTNEESNLPPDFELESLDGTKIKLSDLKGKNVMINFWATWCDFCVLEMPDLQKLQNKYKDDDLVILAVNVGESKEAVQKFMEENKLDLTVVLDKDNAVSDKYGLRSFPSTLAVDKKGEIVTGYVGMLTYEQMEQMYGSFEK